MSFFSSKKNCIYHQDIVPIKNIVFLEAIMNIIMSFIYHLTFVFFRISFDSKRNVEM